MIKHPFETKQIKLKDFKLKNYRQLKDPEP